MRDGDEGQDPHDCGEVECIKETAKAILLKPTDGSEQYWVPKAVVHDDSEVYEEGQEGRLVVKAWWAEKEGLG